MLIGLFAACVAPVLSVLLQFHFSPNIRPLLDQSLHVNIADPDWTSIWDRQGSFPSDTATVFFSLAAVIFLENRLVGCLAFLWVLMVIAVPRVVFAWHYPSDIIGSLVLGPGCVYLFNRISFLQTVVERALKLFENRMYVVHALLFVFLADASNLFLGLQALGKGIVKLLL